MGIVLALFASRAFAGELPADEGEAAAASALPPVTIHVVDVKVKRRVPVNRRIANDLVRNALCVMRLTIDESGVPVSVLPVKCPLSLVPPTTDVAMRWRFHPVMGPSGVPETATFDLPFTYKTPHQHGTEVEYDTPALRAAKEMLWHELQVRRRVNGKYPTDVNRLDYLGTEVTCTVRMHVDETGTPTAADVRGCPDAFARTTEAAAMQWRWYPVLVHGAAVSCQFDQRFVYRLRD